MKLGRILNKKLNTAIADMGHGDMLVICDAGFPIPSEAQRIDLAILYAASVLIEGCDTLPRTVDLETSPGSVMLCHEDEAVVMRDYRSLRKLETRHFEMLFSRAPLAVRVPKMTLNGEPIEILSGESSDWTAMSGH